MRIKLKSVYYAMFIVLFFISYNITIYGYFIPNYIVLAIGLFFILLSLMSGDIVHFFIKRLFPTKKSP